MRKIIVSTIMSIDGYVAGPGGDVMALPMDAFFDEQNLERQRTADTLLLGTMTYLGFKAYWPSVAADPTVSPAVQQDPTVADLHREIGQRDNTMRKIVVSDSLAEADTDPWADTTTIVRRADAHRLLAQEKAGDGRDLLIFSSRILFNDLLLAGLVDELFVMVGPVALGDGMPAFGPGVRPTLRLADRIGRDGSDNVLLHYLVD